MSVQGMTCADCERRISEALTRAGARDVHVDVRRGQVLLDPVEASESGLRLAIEELGYRTTGLQAVRKAKIKAAEPRSGSWGVLLLLVPALCCGAPLLLAAIAVSGVGAWLAASRLVVGTALAVTLALVLVTVWVYRSGALRR